MRTFALSDIHVAAYLLSRGLPLIRAEFTPAAPERCVLIFDNTSCRAHGLCAAYARDVRIGRVLNARRVLARAIAIARASATRSVTVAEIETLAQALAALGL